MAENPLQSGKCGLDRPLVVGDGSEIAGLAAEKVTWVLTGFPDNLRQTSDVGDRHIICFSGRLLLLPAVNRLRSLALARELMGCHDNSAFCASKVTLLSHVL